MERWTEVFVGKISKADYQMQLVNGEFAKQIKNISNGYGEVLNLKHYIIITQNYNVDIITEGELTIEIL